MMSQPGTEVILSIIIINYNLAHEIEDCLNSLIDKNCEIEYEIVLVDNNSADKYLYEVEQKFGQKNIRFYFLDENVGFGQGCNYGVSKSTGKYLCFLNPDTLILEDVFSPIVQIFEKNKSIGIVGPKQMTKKPCFDFSAGFFPNLFFEFFNLLTLGVYIEAFIVFIYTRISKSKYLKVDWILGAAIFIRQDIFKILGGFDKDYFMFFEETDLCKRVANKGYKIIYCPELQIHHTGSVSGKKDYSLFTKRIYSSKYIFITKHFSPLKKASMKFLLFVQIFSQIVLWIIMLPLDKKKSNQKLDGFFYLLKHNMRMN